ETSVTAIFEDRLHRLWAGTNNGLVLVDRVNGEAMQHFLPDAHRADSLPNGLVTSLCQTRDGDLWVGTNNGLARFGGLKDSFRVYAESSDARYSLSSATVLTCYTDKDGALWLGTDNGLDKLDPVSNLVQHLGVKDGLPD